MPRNIEGYIYTLHFEMRYAHAGHYTGWALDLDARLAEHARGTGARLMAVIKDAGIGFVLADVRRGDRYLERRLKNRGGASRRCPICLAERKLA
jgi:hypothetical protein